MASVLLAIEAERLERQKKIVLQRRRSSWAARPPPWAAQLQPQAAQPHRAQPQDDLVSARHERAARASFELAYNIASTSCGCEAWVQGNGGFDLQP